jgi:hypothetical protein
LVRDRRDVDRLVTSEPAPAAGEIEQRLDQALQTQLATTSSPIARTSPRPRADRRALPRPARAER